ncbi:uncharacterized protein KD926_006436 [Aspergillus affinis]|uniref:uncharacterized protein n=1 Tax=Aspergillus affinis TaxID=1070780 RepID=UPI0022FED186|nr:uncharacterized protein KD926_006436 [Aspergillus affinis]KAI9041890.1 hypothetical protein KD926_006436 [Aspergillus affinis]
MRYSILAIVALASSALAQTTSQDPGPSPTASVGCEPHGDHWHCEGPATDAAATVTSVSSESEAETPAVPSPTESVGCEPHGDHWHCDGPASAEATATSTATHSHDHEEEESTATPTVPSPTESVGCEPHGDHWHCDGPAETGESSGSASGSASSTSDAATASSTGADEEGGAGMIGAQMSMVVGLALGVAALQI